MGLLKDIEENFGTEDLYEVLGVTSESSFKEIKAAYYKQSLKTHPDKADDEHKEEANKLFQIINRVYAVLSDKEKRDIYDESGSIPEEDSDGKNWMDYWRLLFPKIQLKDILDFENKYKGSEDERDDLKAHYLRFKGDLNQISEHQLCYSLDEEERYRSIIDEMVSSKEVPKFAAYKVDTKEESTKRKKKAGREAHEAKKLATKLGVNLDSDDSLALAISKQKNEREKSFDSFLSDLEAKYCNPSKPKGKGRKKN